MRARYVVALFVVVLVGCGDDTPQPTVQPEPKPVAVAPADPPPPNPAAPAVEPSESASPTPVTTAFEAILPTAIANETEAAECMAAAVAIQAAVEKLTKQPADVSTTRLPDCVLQQDNNGPGYSKFYPGGLRLRVSGRWANLFVPGVETAVTHATFDPIVISITCEDRSRSRKAMVGLRKISESEPFERSGDWSVISNADQLEAFILSLLSAQ